MTFVLHLGPARKQIEELRFVPIEKRLTIVAEDLRGVQPNRVHDERRAEEPDGSGIHRPDDVAGRR